jgi:Flp pilus assembly protein TadG
MNDDRPRPPRLTGDHGSTLVEFALVIPVIAVFFLGVVEYGYAFREANLGERSTSAAARVVSQRGNARNADFEGLRSLNSSLAGLKRSQLTKVVIYNPDANGNMSTTCKGLAAPSGSSSVGSNAAGAQCNVYSAAMVATANPSVGFPGGTVGSNTCPSGSWDINYCPGSRTTGTVNPSSVGVYTEVTYTSLTKLFGTNIKFERQAYYLLEPTPVGGT